jgi:ABC-type bacteriocin/lantibiotic exporter with double-glycine peptidase domain
MESVSRARILLLAEKIYALERKANVALILWTRFSYLGNVGFQVGLLSSLSHKRGRWPPWLPRELHWLSRQIRPLLHWHIASFLCITSGSLLALLTPLALKWLIDQIIPQRKMGLLLLAVGLIFLGYQGRMAFTSLGCYLMLTAAQRLTLTLRMSLFGHLNKLSAEYYEDTPVGNVMYPLKEPIEEVSYFGSDLLPAILRMFLMVSFTIVTMFALSPVLTLAVLPLIPVFLVARQHFHRRFVAKADTVQRNRLAWSTFLEEHLSSVIPIQLLGQEKRQERRAFRFLAREVRSQQKLFTTSVRFTVWSSLAVVLAMCAVIGYGGEMALSGALSIGGLVAFYGLVTQLFDPLSGAADLYARAQKTFASVRQLNFAGELRPSVIDAPAAPCVSREHPSQIDFAEVRFGYRRQKNMLHIPFLRILPGEQVAIAGENGAGKSTLAKLIARLYDPDSGSIRIGNVDIRNIQLRDLRRYVCYLPRDPVLFDGTLSFNLRFVRPAASDSEVQEAIRSVGLSQFAAVLPDGVRQRIGPGGCQLSGGQRQRLALARAILQQPRILILDEATSCLDPSSERVVIDNIRRSFKTSTLIVISHRPSTFATFGRLLVLFRGEIVEDGNPYSLNFHASLPSNELFSTTSTIDKDLR